MSTVVACEERMLACVFVYLVPNILLDAAVERMGGELGI